LWFLAFFPTCVRGAIFILPVHTSRVFLCDGTSSFLPALFQIFYKVRFPFLIILFFSRGVKLFPIFFGFFRLLIYVLCLMMVKTETSHKK
jgi:hypothetical protein